MPNLALNQPATQSSTSYWSSSKDKTVDARLANNGDTAANVFFHTEKELHPWWQVNLGGVFLVDRLVLYNRIGALSRLTRFSVFRSLDGHRWFRVFKRNDDAFFDACTVDVGGECLARLIRIRLDGAGYLHFRECQVFGRPATAEEQTRLSLADEEATRQMRKTPDGRPGVIGQIGSFYVFIDDAYGSQIKRALTTGRYEWMERQLVTKFLAPTDRVIEAGTAVGVVSMTIGSIVGPQNVITFDANPDIVADARANFARNELDGISSHLGLLTNKAKFEVGSEAEFQISKDFWSSRLDAGGKGDIVETVRIPRRCLEQEISSFRANVLVCDIEGGEVDLLSGADLSVIRLIILETHYWACGEKPTDDMMRRLIMQGFSLHLEASGHSVAVLRRN